MVGAGALPICAAAFAARAVPLRSSSRTSGACERRLTFTSALSGMMLGALPAWIAPIVSTPNAAGSFSRLITVCTSVTKRAAIGIGSIVAAGIEP